MNFKIVPGTITKDRQKIPLINGWKEAATTDPAQIKLWQDMFKDRIHHWVVPTGKTNNILVLDIDIKTNGWQTIKDKNLEIPDSLFQRTLNGGAHFIFEYPNDGKHYGNKVGLLPGIDVRGEGGYIFWYGYESDWSKKILPAPAWLLDLLNNKKTIEVQGSAIKFAPEIAEGIFKECLEKIKEAPTGEGNNVLNIESFKVGQLVASGSFSREFAAERLLQVAKERGRPDYEARATIKSGLDGGAKSPITCPFPATEPTSTILIPPAPETNARWTPPYLTRSDLLNKTKLRKPQLFQDWSTEDIHITTADGGTGKTTLKLYEAICLALGDRFLGFENKQRGKTLFITGEDTAQKLAAMLGAILEQMNVLNDHEKVETILSSIVIKKDADLCLIAKDKQSFLHPNPASMKKILEAVEDIKPKMIVFDPIASFWGSESALNDMNKAVTKFMSELVEKSGACVEMINHMGKSSSANKDMTQFAGRGGSGLPSNSRVSRVLRSLSSEEFTELTNSELVGDQTAMLCNVNKFSDGSPLFNKPFVIVRDGYLFSRVTLTQIRAREMEKEQSDQERIFAYVKQLRENNKYPTIKVVISYFMNCGDPMSKGRVERALSMLEFTGIMGERFAKIANPDLTIKDEALIIVDADGAEVVK